MTADTSYANARRLYESAYTATLSEHPTREQAQRGLDEIMRRMAVLAVADRVPVELRPIFNGKAAAYKEIVGQ